MGINGFSVGWIFKAKFSATRAIPWSMPWPTVISPIVGGYQQQPLKRSWITIPKRSRIARNRYMFWSIIATSHDLAPNGGFSKGNTLISGNVGWWNIIIWSLGQIMFGFLGLKMFAYDNCWVCLRSELSWGLFTDLRPSSDGNLCFVGATHGGL